MGFVKLDPALPRAEPDPWLALLTAGSHGKYPGSEKHRTWRKGVRMQKEMQETHGPGFPLPK